MPIRTDEIHSSALYGSFKMIQRDDLLYGVRHHIATQPRRFQIDTVHIESFVG